MEIIKIFLLCVSSFIIIMYGKTKKLHQKIRKRFCQYIINAIYNILSVNELVLN